MAFIDKFPTYTGTRPGHAGKFLNMEKQRLEDWTHTALKSEEPNPLSISFKALEPDPEGAYLRWVRELAD